MNDTIVAKAAFEARRFLAAVAALEARRKADIEKSQAAFYYFQGCRESGAVRRASLDLTRALADLRKT